MRPIIIAGFGRSGTTWLSDIVSKTLGGMILFEPDHPAAFSDSINTVYQSSLDKAMLDNFWGNLSSKRERSSWLLRNHLLSDGPHSPEFIKAIWDNSEIIGFKSIRWNHALPTLINLSGKRFIYIIRHPLAVTASLLRRPRFFEEYGWQKHWELFKQRNPLKEIDLEQYDDSEKSVKYAVMWSVSNIKALSDIQNHNLPFWSYEELYQDPYNTSQKILAHIGHYDVCIHPSYLFYPSMSTLNTIHAYDNKWDNLKKGDLSFFWKDVLDRRTTKKLLSNIQNIFSQFPNSEQILYNLNYLND